MLLGVIKILTYQYNDLKYEKYRNITIVNCITTNFR
jgi:hypothetical protein